MQQTGDTGTSTRVPVREDDAWLNDVAVTHHNRTIPYEDVPTLPLTRAEAMPALRDNPQRRIEDRACPFTMGHRLWPIVQRLSAQLWHEIHHAKPSATIGDTISTPTLFPSANTLHRRILTLLRSNLALARQVRTKEEMQFLLHCVVDEVVGAGPLEAFLCDTTVTTIAVFHTTQTTVERDGQVETWNNLFADDQHLHRIAVNLLAHCEQNSRAAWPLTRMLLPDQTQLTIDTLQAAHQVRYLVLHHNNTYLPLNTSALLLLLKIH